LISFMCNRKSKLKITKKKFVTSTVYKANGNHVSA
jgi:hypothetical protein